MGPLYAQHGQNMNNKTQAVIAEDEKRGQFTLEQGEKLLDVLEERLEIVSEKFDDVRSLLKEIFSIIPDLDWLKNMTVKNCSQELVDRSLILRDRASEVVKIGWSSADDTTGFESAYSDLHRLFFDSRVSDLVTEYAKKWNKQKN